MSKLTPIHELEINQIVVYQVGGPEVVVTGAEGGEITFSDGRVETSGYAFVKGEAARVNLMKNEGNGLTHAYIGGQPLCRTRNTQSKVQVLDPDADGPTCIRCAVIYHA